MDSVELQKWRRFVAAVAVPLYLAAILVAGLGPVSLGAACFFSGQWVAGCIGVCLTPLTYALTAGVLSLVHQPHVVEGRMCLDTAYRPYFHRRMYGLCWTAVYYSGPIYFLMLSVPPLRKLLFRLFGYRGSMDFTIYPDTWIRDLPLLDFGAGCYLSNKATIGSNMIFIRNGKKVIEIGRIRVGRRAMVGHLSMVGPSTEIGDDVQIGVGCGVGRKVRIGDRSIVGDVVVLDHGSRVDADTVVPTRSYVGMGRRVQSFEELSPGAILTRKRGGRSLVDAIEDVNGPEPVGSTLA